MNRIFSYVTAVALGGATLLSGTYAIAGAVPQPGQPGTPPATAPQTQTLATPSSDAKSATPAYMSYTYYGERYRDPFIPLTGDMRAADLSDRAPQIASLVLKGIVQDANGRMALLVSGVNSYILHGGRLFDGRNRAVKKISGVIKTDSVVLIGADRTVRELRTRTDLY